MKKFFLLSSFLCTFVLGTFAGNPPCFVVTDCGTVHQVPNCMTDEEAAAYVDYYTALDCNPDGTVKQPQH